MTNEKKRLSERIKEFFLPDYSWSFPLGFTPLMEEVDALENCVIEIEKLVNLLDADGLYAGGRKWIHPDIANVFKKVLHREVK